MALVSMTPIDQPSGDLIAVKTDDNRRWKIVTMILTANCLVLMIIITLVASNKLSSYNSINKPIKATTEINTHNNTNITEEITDDLDNSINIDEEEKVPPDVDVTPSPVSDMPITINDNRSVIFTPALISDFDAFETLSGLSLNHSLYYNINHYNKIEGYVTSVTLRLFTSWKDDNPLYIFAISSFFLQHNIAYRYPIVPKRNTTEWQTIEIPVGKFPIEFSNHLAIGMQDNSNTNQIYGVRSTVSIHGENITHETMNVHPQVTKNFYGVAFTYTVLEHIKESDEIIPRIRR